MKKRIGILTYHYSINEGAMLQAYALQETSKKIFEDCEVEIINIESFNIKKRDFSYCYRPPRKFNIIKKRFFRYVKLLKFKYNNFRLTENKYTGDNYKKAVKFLQENKYDLIIVGSDEVWKVAGDADAGRGFPNICWLSDKIFGKKVSYAASAHKTIYHKLPGESKNFIKQSLKQFSLLGVRDEGTKNMIIEALGDSKDFKNNLVKVLDPTFLYDFSKEKVDIEKILEENGIKSDKPIALFICGNEKVCRIAREYLKKKEYQIISIGYYNKQADFNLINELNPIEWANIFGYSQFCLTERYHGTIMSIKYKIPFLSVDTAPVYRKFNSKIKQLLVDLNLAGLLLDLSNIDYTEAQIANKIEFALDYNYSQNEKLIKKKIEDSLDFINRFKNLL